MRWQDETRLAAQHMGFNVVETDGITDWQGWGVHLLQSHSGQWAVLAWSYGSCGGCDAYEDAFSYGEYDSPEKCAAVFGDLIEACESEGDARALFSDRKGW